MFLQKVNNIEKMINSQIAVANKKKELAVEYDQLVPKLKLIQQKNKQLITEVSNFKMYSSNLSKFCWVTNLFPVKRTSHLHVLSPF